MTANVSEVDFDYLKSRCSEFLEGFVKKLETQQITWYGYELKEVEARWLAFINSKVFLEDAFDQYLGLHCRKAAAVCQSVGALQIVVMHYCEQRKTGRQGAAEKDVTIRKEIIALEAKKPFLFCPRPNLRPVLEKALQKTFRTKSIKRLGLQGNHLPSLARIFLNAASGGKLCHYVDKEEGPQPLGIPSKSDGFAGHVHVTDAEENRKRATESLKIHSDAFLKVDHLQVKTRNPIDIQNGDSKEETSVKELIISSPNIVTLTENMVREDLVVKPVPPYLSSFLARGKTNVKFK